MPTPEQVLVEMAQIALGGALLVFLLQTLSNSFSHRGVRRKIFLSGEGIFYFLSFISRGVAGGQTGQNSNFNLF